MPSKSSKALASHILLTEKKVAKLEQQLLKARNTKVTKLQKTVDSLKSKLKQSQSKLANKPAKKTASTLRQAQVLKTKIIDLKSALAQGKQELNLAKVELKQATEIEKAVKLARRLTNKTTLKKKNVKKTLSKKAKVKALTPDLSKPVVKKSTAKKTSKIWQPKELEKAPETEKPKKKKTKRPAKKTPVSVKENKEEVTASRTVISTSVAATVQKNATPSVKEQTETVTSDIVTQTEADNTLTEDISSRQDEAPTIPTANPPPSIESEEGLTEDNNIKDKVESEKETPITNWHTMPILRKQDD